MPPRSSLRIGLAVAIVALSPFSLSAVKPAEIVGAWVISVDSRQSPKSVDLEIVHQPDEWKVTLRSGAGAVTTSRVNLEADVLRIQYGSKPLGVQVELTVLGETMNGSVVTGQGDTRRRQTITAHRVPATDSPPASKQVAQSNKPVEQARKFFGAWELSLRMVDTESPGAIRMGMVVTESDGKPIVGHSEFGMMGPQERVDEVQATPDGLRWILDGGMFGVLNVDLIPEGEKLRVEVNGADQRAFLEGTAIRKPKPSDVGVDREQLIQKPGTELVGVIGGEARVVEINGDTIIIQQNEVVSRMLKGDPLLAVFRWFRLPDRSRLIAVESNTAWSVAGATIQSWDIRRPTPSALGSCELPGNPPELVHRSGPLVFAANWNGHADSQQLHVIDVSDPSNPRLLASHNTPKGVSNYDLAVSGSTIYLANAVGLRIADATNPQTLVTRGTFVGRGRWVRGVDVAGSTAYIATSMHGDASWLQVIDVSDPTTPVQKGVYRSTGGAQDVSVAGDLAVLADRGAGMVVLDVSEPQRLRRLGYFRTKGRASKVDIFGKLAFVAVDGDSGARTLHVIRYAD